MFEKILLDWVIGILNDLINLICVLFANTLKIQFLIFKTISLLSFINSFIICVYLILTDILLL
jgi:hypothetical protein